MDLQFVIQYKKGCHNVVADALSRCSSDNSMCVMSPCLLSRIHNLQQGYQDDTQAQQLLTELNLSHHSKQGYALQEGVIRYEGRVWVDNNSLGQQHLLQVLYNGGIREHLGYMLHIIA